MVQRKIIVQGRDIFTDLISSTHFYCMEKSGVAGLRNKRNEMFFVYFCFVRLPLAMRGGREEMYEGTIKVATDGTWRPLLPWHAFEVVTCGATTRPMLGAGKGKGKLRLALESVEHVRCGTKINSTWRRFMPTV